ncbi:YceD family protein [Virgibacillus ndiopensis]|uniref:YceD family protein n=1 Tax=Virgibacillus ndiopensis TaxID=2004408 RepID=UPI000C088825|nr:YceD family protein [Virgibacillus ndiopensis]
MKFSVGQIKRTTHNEPFTFDGKVDVSELETMNNDIRKIEPVHVFGQCYIQGEQLFFSFTIKGEMILPCARTLVDVPYPFEIRADEVFSLSPYYGEEEMENEIHPIDGEMLDLTPYIKENILLEVPFRVFSDDAKEGAPMNGDGWDFISDEKSEQKIDPRLKKLESLLKDNEKEK